MNYENFIFFESFQYKHTFKFIRTHLMKLKFFARRAVTYLTIANSGMILFLFLIGLKEYNINIGNMLIPIFILSAMLVIVIGWLDYKFGLFREEQKYVFSNIPQLEKIDKIQEDIKEIRRKLE